MKFNCGPTREEKIEQKRKVFAAQLREEMTWRKVFAWLPVRIGKTRKCCWLEFVEERLIISSKSFDIAVLRRSLEFLYHRYEYREIE